jgi:hypothetical protein
MGERRTRRVGPPGRPRLVSSRRRAIVALVVFGGLGALLIGRREIFRTVVDVVSPGALSPRVRHSGPPRPPAAEALLLRQRQGMNALLDRTRGGRLLEPAAGRVVVAVDQALVQSLLSTYLPADHTLEAGWQVHLNDAQVTFEDGLALVRLVGRISPADAPPEELFADLEVWGDLSLAETQPRPDVLLCRVNLIAVEAKRVDVVVRVKEAESLVADVGRARLSDFAALAPAFEIPVRREHTVEIPGTPPGEEVRIAPVRIDVRLTLADMDAHRGRLWLAMDVELGSRAEMPVRPSAGSGVPRSWEPATDPSLPPEQRLARLRQEHEALHQRLEQQLAADTVLVEMSRVRGDLVALVPAPVAVQVAAEVVRRYLDRVELELEGLRFHKEAELHRETFLGRLHAGDWSLGARVHRVRGVLRAGTPKITLPGRNRVDVAVPVHIESGRGEATLDFAFDSKGLAGLVCRDFELSETVQGTVPRDVHTARGHFQVDIHEGNLVARPRFDRTYRIAVEPTSQAWEKARAALETQDKLFRCGLAMEPAAVLEQIRQIVAKGLRVRLPEKLFRPLSLPVQVSREVEVGDRHVRLEVADSSLDLGRERLTVAASVRATRAGTP